MVSLLLLIACDITSCSFHSRGFILSSIQRRQWNCSICYEPDTKRLIMARLSVIWNFFSVLRGFWHSHNTGEVTSTSFKYTYVHQYACFVLYIKHCDHISMAVCSDYREQLSSALTFLFIMAASLPHPRNTLGMHPHANTLFGKAQIMQWDWICLISIARYCLGGKKNSKMYHSNIKSTTFYFYLSKCLHKYFTLIL